MNGITQQTRRESYEQVLETLGERHAQCLQGLKALGECTASELAHYFYASGLTPTFNRNYAHPRLNELVEMGHVRTVGKKKCQFSGRSVAIYEIINRGEN